jgi:glycosyltransferase involved in cell wall biosynthesis
MIKLIIIQTVAPDYRVFFFERIKEVLTDKFELYAGEESFETTIKTKSKIHKKLNNHFLLNRKLLFQTGIWHLLFKKHILVLEMNPRNISNWIFLLIRKLSGKKTVLWGHAWPRNGQNSKSDFLRNLMRKLASKIIVYTKQQQKELQLKMPNKPILTAPNAVYRIDNMKTTTHNNQVNLIYVGRLVSSKKVFFMVKAFHNALSILPKKVKLFIVGDGEEKEKLNNYINEFKLHERIILFGHINDYSKLQNLYNDSIFSLSPGYVGLSITQSFSFGVPMLVSKNENHSPEIEAVHQNENALFFETDDVKDFSKVLKNIYNNIELWKNKRKEIVYFCKTSYSIESMTKVFINLIN